MKEAMAMQMITRRRRNCEEDIIIRNRSDSIFYGRVEEAAEKGGRFPVVCVCVCVSLSLHVSILQTSRDQFDGLYEKGMRAKQNECPI